MPRRARMHSNSGYYHIVSRGIGKQILFECTEDYVKLLDTLKKCAAEENVRVIAYCLMENHFHLLLHTDSGLDRIMKRIAIRYAYYYNTKYERSGHLFQDRYKSEPINDERYLVAVIRYIQNNPQKAGICPREEYPWSSWQEYMGEANLISKDPIMDIMGSKENFESFSESNEKVECLEISGKRCMPDNTAKEIIQKVLHLNSGTMIQAMNREERDAALRKLKDNGLSIRQIERLTGINRGVVQRA